MSVQSILRNSRGTVVLFGYGSFIDLEPCTTSIDSVERGTSAGFACVTGRLMLPSPKPLTSEVVLEGGTVTPLGCTGETKEFIGRYVSVDSSVFNVGLLGGKGAGGAFHLPKSNLVPSSDIISNTTLRAALFEGQCRAI
jgi:hypothetical protein